MGAKAAQDSRGHLALLGVRTQQVCRVVAAQRGRRWAALTTGFSATVIQQPSAEVRGEDQLQAAAVVLARAAQRRGLDLSTAIGQLRQAW